MKWVYLDDRMIAIRGMKVLYGFKIKNGIHGDLKKCFQMECNRFGFDSGSGFEKVQKDYNG